MQVFDLYGIGSRQTFSTPNLLKEVNLKVFILYLIENHKMVVSNMDAFDIFFVKISKEGCLDR